MNSRKSENTPEPFTGSEVIEAIESVHTDSVAYWNTFDNQAFFDPIGEAWSPSENVRHLTKSMRAVTLGLRLPRIALLFRFGRPKQDSRTYTAVREVYRDALAAGGKAGKFAPEKVEIPDDTGADRTKIMQFHKKAVDGLCSAIARWPEDALDKRQMPHPLIGKLSVREMLFFTLYHNQHHVENVKRRMKNID